MGSNPWLKGGTNHYFQLRAQNLTMDDLIHSETRTWNHELIASQGNQEDNNRITSMILLPTHSVDELIWAKTKDGTYSIRSAYYHVMELLIDNSDLKADRCWSYIW